MKICKNCKAEVSLNYCPNCGSPAELTRIDGTYVMKEIGRVLNFDRGILFTIRELVVRPGKTIRDFILEDRNRLVKPIVFLLVCSLFYSLIQQIFRFEDGYVGYSLEKDSTVAIIFKWVSGNYGYSNIIMGIFIAIWIKIFFKKYGYNFYEILILLCFVMGMGMVMFAFFGMADSLLDYEIVDKGYTLGILYILWAISQFFDGKKIINYPKTLLAYFLGMISFMIGIYMVGGIIDFFK